MSFVPFVAFSVIGARANLVRGTFLYSLRICDFGLILWLGLGLGLFFLCTLLLSLLVPSIKNRIPIQVKGIKIVSFKRAKRLLKKGTLTKKLFSHLRVLYFSFRDYVSSCEIDLQKEH